MSVSGIARFSLLVGLVLVAQIGLTGCNLFNAPATRAGAFGWGGSGAAIHTASISSSVIVSTGTGARLDRTATSMSFSASSTSRAIAPSYEVIGKIEAPFVAGKKVQATHVTVFKGKAYVSYNTAGEAYGGAIDVVDIADPVSPKLLQSLTLPETDIAASFVVANGSTLNLYIAGAMSKNSLAGIFRFGSAELVPSTAILQRFVIREDGTFDPADKNALITLLPGYVTTSVFQTGDPIKRYIFVTTGNDILSDPAVKYEPGYDKGGTFALDASTLGIIDKDSYNYAMYLDIDNARSLHLSLQGAYGDEGILHIYKVGKSDASAHKMLSLGTVNTYGTKNTIDLSGDFGFVALGAEGMKAYNVADASLPISETPVKRDPAFIIPMGEAPVGIDKADWLCNSVSSDGTYVYLASGAGGLWIANLSTELPAGGTVELKVWKALDFSSSANFVNVDTDSKLIFVASGGEGTKIVSGKP